MYEAPNNTKDSEKLKQAIKTLDKYVGVVVTYDFSDRKETLDGSEINKWLKVDSEKNYDITFDNDAMVEYTRGLSKNTVLLETQDHLKLPQVKILQFRVEFMVG